MEKPTIKINGKIIEMPKMKARSWTAIMKFETERPDIEMKDYVNRHCEIMASVFGITTEEVLDNLEIGEVVPKYFEVFNYVAQMLTERLGKKNVEAAELAESN